MKCIETRTREVGVVYRRYRDAAGDVHVTYEVPAAVLRAVGMGRVRRIIKTAQAGARRRKEAKERKARVASLLREGKTVTEVARLVGVTEARIRQLRTELKEN